MLASNLIEDTGFSGLLLLNLSLYVVWVEIYKENLTSQRYAEGKGRNMLMAFQIIADFFSNTTTKSGKSLKG